MKFKELKELNFWMKKNYSINFSITIVLALRGKMAVEWTWVPLNLVKLFM